jgi:hypothetical protein
MIRCGNTPTARAHTHTHTDAHNTNIPLILEERRANRWRQPPRRRRIGNVEGRSRRMRPAFIPISVLHTGKGEGEI